MCVCPAGYAGARCETNIDDCLNHSCANNATCIDGVLSYTCACAAGFMGELCDRPIPFCAKEFNPCRNGATCRNLITHYACDCVPGFTGDNCTVNVDDCQNNMCQVMNSSDFFSNRT